MTRIICAYCGSRVEKCTREINRAKNTGAPLYCNRTCAGLGRRQNKTKAQKIEEKRLYDAAYRAKNIEILKRKKSAHYQRTRDPVKEALIRKERMHLHVEYCRQPEYRKWKKDYDRKYRAAKIYGEYAEPFMLLMDIENEVLSRMSRYEIYAANGTLNKHKARRRDYDKNFETISR